MVSVLSKTDKEGLLQLKKAVLLYGTGLLALFVSIAIIVFYGGYFLLAIILFPVEVILLFLATSKTQSGLEALRKNNSSFSISVKLSILSSIMIFLGVILVLIAFFMPFLLTSSGPSSFSNSLPTPTPSEMALYNLYTIVQDVAFYFGLILILEPFFGASVGFWKLGETYKKDSLKYAAIGVWIPILNLIAFLVSYLEIEEMLK